VFLHLGQNREIAQEDLEKVMKALDKDQDGKVSREELAEMIQRCCAKK
jgi:Ca2+-binding EF-hand superfamily protein